MRTNIAYVVTDDVVEAVFPEPMLSFEIDKGKVTKAASRKMGSRMVIDWYNITDDGLIESIEYVKELE